MAKRFFPNSDDVLQLYNIAIGHVGFGLWDQCGHIELVIECTVVGSLRKSSSQAGDKNALQIKFPRFSQKENPGNCYALIEKSVQIACYLRLLIICCPS